MKDAVPLASLFLGLCFVIASALVASPACVAYFIAGLLLWALSAVTLMFGRS